MTPLSVSGVKVIPDRSAWPVHTDGNGKESALGANSVSRQVLVEGRKASTAARPDPPESGNKNSSPDHTGERPTGTGGGGAEVHMFFPMSNTNTSSPSASRFSASFVSPVLGSVLVVVGWSVHPDTRTSCAPVEPRLAETLG